MPSVSFTQSEETYPIEIGEVIFDSLDNQGKKLPHGCLSGSCGACRIMIASGSEILEKPSAIEQDTIQAIKKERSLTGEIRLSCRAKVIQDGDVKIEPC